MEETTEPAARLSAEETAEAAARGEAFVAQVRRRAAARDWERVLGDMRDALRQLCATDLVQQDIGAQYLIALMTQTTDWEEIDFLADQLRQRVDAVIAATAAQRSGEAVEPAPERTKAPLPSAVAAAAEQAHLGAAATGRRKRTVIKL